MVKVEVKSPLDWTSPSAVCISPVPPPSASQHCIVSSAVGQKVIVTTVSLVMMFLTSLDNIRSVFVVEYMGLNFLGCLKLQCSVYCLHSTSYNHGILGGGGGGEGAASPRLDTPVFGMHFPRPAPIRCTALHRLICCWEECQSYYCVACDDVSIRLSTTFAVFSSTPTGDSSSWDV